MDINRVRTLLKLNTLDGASDEAAIQSVLRQAYYSDEEIAAALVALRQSSELHPTEPDVFTTSPKIPTSQDHPPLRTLWPKRFFSLRTLFLVLLGYFVVLPLTGVLLFNLGGMFGYIPGVSELLSTLAIPLFFIGVFTGLYEIGMWYQLQILSLVVAIANQNVEPYPILPIECDSGYTIEVQGTEKQKVVPVYFDAATIGYRIDKDISGTMLVASEQHSQEISLPPRLDTQTSHDIPFVPLDDFFQLPLFENRRIGAETSPLETYYLSDLNTATGYGTGEAPYDNASIVLDHTLFSASDFGNIRDCLDAYQKTNGKLRTASDFLRTVFAVIRDEHSIPNVWHVSGNNFTCSSELAVSFSPPHFLVTEGGHEGSNIRIGIIGSDLKPRPFTQKEKGLFYYDDYALSQIVNYEDVKTCLATGGCMTQQSGGKVLFSPPHMEGGLFADAQDVIDFEKSYLSYLEKDSVPKGLRNGFPKDFSSCINSDGEDVMTFLKNAQ